MPARPVTSRSNTATTSSSTTSAAALSAASCEPKCGAVGTGACSELRRADAFLPGSPQPTTGSLRRTVLPSKAMPAVAAILRATRHAASKTPVSARGPDLTCSTARRCDGSAATTGGAILPPTTMPAVTAVTCATRHAAPVAAISARSGHFVSSARSFGGRHEQRCDEYGDCHESPNCMNFHISISCFQSSALRLRHLFSEKRRAGRAPLRRPSHSRVPLSSCL